MAEKGMSLRKHALAPWGGHEEGRETRVRGERVSPGTRRSPSCGAHLVEAKEAQVTDHAESADSGPGGDLSCHLQADLHNLQGVGEDHLGASSLDSQQKELVEVFLHTCNSLRFSNLDLSAKAFDYPANLIPAPHYKINFP